MGSAAFYHSDLESEAAFDSIVLPILVTLSLMALALWFVALFHNSGMKQTYSSNSDTGGGSGFGGDAGGDGGDGGC